MNLLIALSVLAATSPRQTSQEISVSAASAVVIEAQTGKVLWQKAGDVPRYPASTTKVMTALLLLEHCRAEEILTVDKDSVGKDGASLNLKEGETLSARNMLEGLLLRSANDACEVVAKHVAGSVPKFAEMMNARAKQIGCTNTNFDNPHGLPDPLHVTTAHDLALIAREAMKQPEFRAVVRNRKLKIDRSLNKEDTVVISKNKWLKLEPTADGIKTGFTKEAGHCFIGSATRNGTRMISVVLKSDDWLKDTKTLIDWAFVNHQREVIAKAGQLSFELPVRNGNRSLVRAAIKDNIVAVGRNGRVGKPTMVPASDAIATAPVERGQVIGSLICTDPVDGFKQRIPLVAMESVPRGGFGASAGNPAFLIGVGLFGTGTYLMRRKTRRTIDAYRR